MTQSKQDFILQKINELVDSVIEQECLQYGDKSFDALKWVKFYAKDLASKCEGCEEAPHGSENEKPKRFSEK
jgi:hypothetical protein